MSVLLPKMTSSVRGKDCSPLTHAWPEKSDKNPLSFSVLSPKKTPTDAVKFRRVNSLHGSPAVDLPDYIVDPTTRTTYLKGRLLGKGGFARVHELKDLTTNTVYAGKIIPKCRISKPRHREKVVREIDLHRTLSHLNVVKFHHFFEDDINVYIILENCPNKSLFHILKNRKTLTEAEVRYYLKQLAMGVKYIHSKGLLHRDLKLGNMFVSESMLVKIGDFGLATKLNRRHMECKPSICGTPNYIAPEVLSREGYGFEADIWAIGCIMYAMLVGWPPFETTTLKETYNNIAHNKYIIPPLVSTPARQLIKVLLSPKPKDRPTLDELLAHEFFSTGYSPETLPASVCHSQPTGLGYNLESVYSPPRPWSLSSEYPTTTTTSQSPGLSVPAQPPPSLVTVAVKTLLSPDKQSAAALVSNAKITATQSLSRKDAAKLADAFGRLMDGDKENEDGDNKVSALCSLVQARPRVLTGGLVRSITTNSIAPKVSSACNTLPRRSVNAATSTVGLNPPTATSPTSNTTNSAANRLSSPQAASALSPSQNSANKKNRTFNGKSPQSPGDNYYSPVSRKDTSLQSAIRQRITSILCPDKAGKKMKPCTASTLYHALNSCLENLPTDHRSSVAAEVPNANLVYIAKWIDYSNKYGFAFQLTDRSVGVLFNDQTKVSYSADRARVEFHDVAGKVHSHPSASIPSSLHDRFKLLSDFTQYMDENLTEGGDSKPVCKNKGVIPHMKRWVRTPTCIIMQLSNGTHQINFFKDHTKVICSQEKGELHVTYINEQRKSVTYKLAQLSSGCDAQLHQRLLYTTSVLKEFIDLDLDHGQH